MNQSEAGSAAPSDRRPSEAKRTSFTGPSYATVFAAKGNLEETLATDGATAIRQVQTTSSSTRRTRYLDLHGKHLETITALGRASVIIKRGDKALKIPRRLDTTHMTELHRLREEDMRELNLESIENEIRIYEHLGPHSGILEVRSFGSVIEMPFMANGTLQSYLQKNQVDWDQKLWWIREAVHTIHDIHQNGVIHGDISTMNFLIADDMSILLSDFGESGLEIDPDGLNGLSKKTDLFQFGSFVFEIITGRKYVLDVREDEVEQWPTNCEIPDVEGFPLKALTRGCWLRDGFQNMSEVSNHLEMELES